MAVFTRIIFVAPRWRKVLDEAAGIIRMEAIPPDGDDRCVTIAEPIALSPAIEMNYTCEDFDCEGGCELSEAAGGVYECKCPDGDDD